MYVKLILKKEKYILWKLAYDFGYFGSAEINFRDLGSISKILLGSGGIIFSGILGDQSIIFREPLSKYSPWRRLKTVFFTP